MNPILIYVVRIKANAVEDGDRMSRMPLPENLIQVGMCLAGSWLANIPLRIAAQVEKGVTMSVRGRL